MQGGGVRGLMQGLFVFLCREGQFNCRGRSGNLLHEKKRDGMVFGCACRAGMCTRVGVLQPCGGALPGRVPEAAYTRKFGACSDSKEKQPLSRMSTLSSTARR